MPGLYDIALQAAMKKSKQIEDTVQDRRLEHIQAMREDLDRYAAARELSIHQRRMAIEERIRRYRQQPQLLDTGQDLRILGEEHRLRELDEQQEALTKKVADRRELLGNMEIVVGERPELLSVALVEFTE